MSLLQIMKPMLPRKITSCARINLNKYWNILEELVTCSMPHYEIQDGGRDSDMSNEINENLANERLEMSSGATCHLPGAHHDHRRPGESDEVGMGAPRSYEVIDCGRGDPGVESGLLDSRLPLSLVELSLSVIKLGA
ncbi:hypothetical protein PR048_006145 [Dryococelus australis]|uniref:Uncharacterized protein n=1 Tax=Dryococelus australis TaxID=614101 RepID=A0ABQ9IA65_9NEOP|nr:hypothetical protein PR048_006145 [Dryococelus australis]